MNKPSILCTAIASFTFSFAPVYAQNTEKSALPDISKDSAPDPLITSQATPKQDQDTDRKTPEFFNPLQAILEKEEKQKSGNQTKFWRNEKEEERLEKELQEKNAQASANEPSSEKTAEPDKAPPTESKDSEPSVSKENTQDTQTPLEDLSEDELKELQDKLAEQMKEREESTKKSSSGTQPSKDEKTKQIQTYKNAVKNVPKPQAPERLWSID